MTGRPAELANRQNLFVGSSLRQADHFTILEGIIPNSRLTINPPRLPNEPSSDPARPIRASSAWHKELYLRPGDWAGWVVAVLIGLMIALGGVVWGLHQNEKVGITRSTRRWMALTMPLGSARTRWNGGAPCTASTSKRYESVSC